MMYCFGLQIHYSATTPTKATQEFFFCKLANTVRVMKQQNSRNLNFVVGNLSYIINFVKIHCSDVRFSLASLQEIFLCGLG